MFLVALHSWLLLNAALFSPCLSRFPTLQTSRVIVVDDFNWAKKYSHIMPANTVASPYVQQYQIPPETVYH